VKGSLKMQKQYSVFSEGFTETMGTDLFSVNGSLKYRAFESIFSE